MTMKAEIKVDNHRDVNNALEQIDPTTLTGDEWLRTSMACQAAGIPYDIWDAWCRRDPKRYDEAENRRRWDSFDASGRINGGTLIWMARRDRKRLRHSGETEKEATEETAQDAQDDPEFVLDLTSVEPSTLPYGSEGPDLSPADQLCVYFDAMYKPGETVNIVIQNAVRANKTTGKIKMTPVGKGLFYERDEAKDAAGGILDSVNPDAGGWTRVNPTERGCITADRVTNYRCAVVECDDLPIDDQLKLIRILRLPCAAIIFSGNKSIHAIVKIDAKDKAEYDIRVRYLYNVCDANGLPVDPACKDAARLTRLPGAQRGEVIQRLIAINVGEPSWDMWYRFAQTHTPEQLPPEELKYPIFDDNKRYRHDQLAQDLMYHYHARFIDGQPCVWLGREKGYVIGYSAWESAALDLYRESTRAQRTEALSSLKLMAPHCKMGDPRYVACANGRLDVLTGELVALIPDDNIPNIIPIRWNPDAYDEMTDKVLDEIACHNPEIRANLNELFGLVSYRGSGMRAMAVLIGETGGNGKSTVIGMLQHLLGKNNYSSLDLATIGRRFQSAALMGKLANLGDDISNEFVHGAQLAVVKKVVTGDTVAAEIKGGPTFSFRPYCTLVFTANAFPRIGDVSGGMMERLHPIPLRAQSCRDDGAPRVLDMAGRLNTPESREYLLRLGVEALPAMMERGGMTPTDYSREKAHEIRVEGDNVLAYCEGKTADAFLGKCPSDEYLSYKAWCVEGSMHPMSQVTFTRHVGSALGITTENNGHGEEGKRRVWVPKQ